MRVLVLYRMEYPTVLSYFRAVPVRTECYRWTDYHPTTWSPSISMPRPLPTLPVHATHCPLPRPTASAFSHAEPARVSRLRVVQHHFAPFFSFPLLSCYSLLHESVRLYGLSTRKRTSPEFLVNTAFFFLGLLCHRCLHDAACRLIKRPRPSKAQKKLQSYR